MLTVFYLKCTDFPAAYFPADFFSSALPERAYREAEGLRNEKVRFARLTGLLLLDYGLRKLYGAGKEEYGIARGKQGKPFLPGKENRYFNISHSGEYVVCAFSDTEVGIDIEKVAQPRLEVARRFFHPEEIRFLEKGGSGPDSFYDIWVIKESYVKYRGTGLACPLASFCAESRPEGWRIRENGRLLPLVLRECAVDEDYKCYVCSEKEELPVVVSLKWEEMKTGNGGKRIRQYPES